RSVRRALRPRRAVHPRPLRAGAGGAMDRAPLRYPGNQMLTVKGLCTDYIGERGQAIRAANDVGFEVPAGKLFTLLGPSGCGKTTTLRSIAGLERPRQGEISVGGDVVYSSQRSIFVPPNRRGLGMVFQSYAIWPHMTVFENAAFPLRVGRRKLGKREIEERVLR